MKLMILKVHMVPVVMLMRAIPPRRHASAQTLLETLGAKAPKHVSDLVYAARCNAGMQEISKAALARQITTSCHWQRHDC